MTAALAITRQWYQLHLSHDMPITAPQIAQASAAIGTIIFYSWKINGNNEVNVTAPVLLTASIQGKTVGSARQLVSLLLMNFVALSSFLCRPLFPSAMPRKTRRRVLYKDGGIASIN